MPDGRAESAHDAAMTALSSLHAALQVGAKSWEPDAAAAAVLLLNTAAAADGRRLQGCPRRCRRTAAACCSAMLLLKKRLCAMPLLQSEPSWQRGWKV